MCDANCHRVGVDLSCVRFTSKLEQLVNGKETSKHHTREQGKNTSVPVYQLEKHLALPLCLLNGSTRKQLGQCSSAVVVL